MTNEAYSGAYHCGGLFLYLEFHTFVVYNDELDAQISLAPCSSVLECCGHRDVTLVSACAFLSWTAYCKLARYSSRERAVSTVTVNRVLSEVSISLMSNGVSISLMSIGVEISLGIEWCYYIAGIKVVFYIVDI